MLTLHIHRKLGGWVVAALSPFSTAFGSQRRIIWWRGLKSYLRLLCVLALVFVGATSANAQTAQAIATKAFSSTVLLVMEDANGQPLSLGSGLFVGAGEIASNLHVVEGAVRGYAKLVGQNTKHDLEGITAVDSNRDLVVLKIAATGSPGLLLGNSDAVQVGEPVYAVGNPQGLEGTFSQGVVSSIREIGTDKLLQITAPISPGSSGGPVLNGKGEVIGVSVATFRSGQNLNFAIPSNYLKLLLEEVGPAKPLALAAPLRHAVLAETGDRRSESETSLSLGLQTNVLPYFFEGYDLAVWVGRDKFRSLGFLQRADILEVFLRDGFENSRADMAYGIYGDYFHGKNFNGLFFVGGLVYFNGQVQHESEVEAGKAENIVLRSVQGTLFLWAGDSI